MPTVLLCHVYLRSLCCCCLCSHDPPIPLQFIKLDHPDQIVKMILCLIITICYTQINNQLDGLFPRKSIILLVSLLYDVLKHNNKIIT